jgi:hypothetical protein
MDQSLKNTNDSGKRNPKTVAGYLASALDMEELLSSGVYGDYLDPKNWPPNLESKTFETIKEHILTLLDGIEKHKKMFSDLNRLYGNDT